MLCRITQIKNVKMTKNKAYKGLQRFFAYTIVKDLIKANITIIILFDIFIFIIYNNEKNNIIKIIFTKHS